jgi:hypothetical protein
MSENETTESLNTGDRQLAPSPEEVQLSFSHAENPKPKKKKKNKKKEEKPRSKTVFYDATGAPVSAPVGGQAEPLIQENYSPVESLAAAPQTVLELPAKPDEWFIQPATYDREGNLLTEEIFIFLKDSIEIVKMPLNEDNFAGLSQLLNERFNNNASTEADFFHVRKPLTDSEESDPVMTLTQGKRILATTSLDQKTLKRLIKALQTHVIQSSPVTAWLNRWWKKHKFWRVILVIGAIPAGLVLLYTIYWGSTH